MNKWKINEPDRQVSDSLAKDTGLPPFVSRLLVSRGITSREAADIFFNSSEFSDPFDIKDMDKAVNAINAAVADGTGIMIYGDYDCDGITSTYILYSYLEALGAEVSWYIPSRDEGYGLNMAAIDRFAKQGVGLIITVDNGISAYDEAEHIRELGMKLVVTDHHTVPEKLPFAEAVVNPHRPDDISQYKELAGCGVALKLIMAMEGDSESVLTQFADIAAIGTVGDIVRLDGENRIIVREGLRLMENTENMGLNRLMIMSGIEQGSEITSTDLGFKICPRINAAGRCGSPNMAMEMLLAPTMNIATAKALELCELNDERKNIELEIVERAEEQIRNDPDVLNRRMMIVAGDGWKHGVIGLASSRILHKYGKPNIVITCEGETARGSARSTEELPLYKLLDSCGDMLIRYGGHTKAAGFSLSSDMVEAFTEAAYKYCDENVKVTSCETLTADMELSPADLTTENIDVIRNLEPFGEGNQVPQFLLRGCRIKSKKSLKEGKYVSICFEFGGTEHRAVHFGSTYGAFPFGEGDEVDMIARLEVNEYREKRNINIFVSDMRFSGFDQQRYFAAVTAYEDYRLGRVDPRLLCRMAPENSELRTIYDILRGTTSLSKAEILAAHADINPCKFRIILDVFGEFGLAAADVTKGEVRLLPVRGKADLAKSKVIAGLRAGTK